MASIAGIKDFGIDCRILSFAVAGTLALLPVDPAPSLLAVCNLTILEVKVIVKIAPTGQPIIVDVYRNGVTIFTNPANRPTIAIGALTADSGAPDVVNLNENHTLTIRIIQVGNVIAGSDLTVEVVCRKGG